LDDDEDFPHFAVIVDPANKTGRLLSDFRRVTEYFEVVAQDELKQRIN
jgi:hypothetical protein